MPRPASRFPDGVTAAQATLDRLVQVRIRLPELFFQRISAIRMMRSFLSPCEQIPIMPLRFKRSAIEELCIYEQYHPVGASLR